MKKHLQNMLCTSHEMFAIYIYFYIIQLYSFLGRFFPIVYSIVLFRRVLYFSACNNGYCDQMLIKACFAAAPLCNITIEGKTDGIQQTGKWTFECCRLVINAKSYQEHFGTFPLIYELCFLFEMRGHQKCFTFILFVGISKLGPLLDIPRNNLEHATDSTVPLR